VTVAEFAQMVFAAVERCNICDSPLIVRLRGPSIKLRIDLFVGGYIEAYYNEETGTTAFALVEDGVRIYGADNTKGWHSHPFENPTLHLPLTHAIKFEDFLAEAERRLA
jgi:hypothetical protein